MNIHEYHAKELLRSCKVPLLPGGVASTWQEAVERAEQLGSGPWMVKAQIHAGGRGQAGGVIEATTLEEVKEIAQRLLGKPLITPQTGPKGQQVQRVYVEQRCEIEQEFYLSFFLERAHQGVGMMASREGGVHIEEVAKKAPDKIVKQVLDPLVGMSDFIGRRVGFFLGLPFNLIEHFCELLKNLYQAFMSLEGQLLEINPLVLTKDQQLLVLDSKMTLDPNSLFRHPPLMALYDSEEEDPQEAEARSHNLHYVKLDGTIGCMVNGAGLAMATMDLIHHYGGASANFLDVGGGASQEKVEAAFKIILSDPHVKGILVNIFGGIMRCDVIAAGIVSAAQEKKVQRPMVVRLQGTHHEQGLQILQQANLPLYATLSFEEAAQKIVQAVHSSQSLSSFLEPKGFSCPF